MSFSLRFKQMYIQKDLRSAVTTPTLANIAYSKGSRTAVIFWIKNKEQILSKYYPSTAMSDTSHTISQNISRRHHTHSPGIQHLKPLYFCYSLNMAVHQSVHVWDQVQFKQCGITREQRVAQRAAAAQVTHITGHYNPKVPWFQLMFWNNSSNLFPYISNNLFVFFCSALRNKAAVDN